MPVNSALLIMTTCPNQDEANKLARELVEKKLAACVQLSDIHSVYRWQESLEVSDEVRLLIKTTETAYPDVESHIKQSHSYDLPEIITIAVHGGSEAYMDWMVKQLNG